MIIDGHVHIRTFGEKQSEFLERLHKAGVDGAVLVSLPPECFPGVAATGPAAERMDHLLSWVNPDANIYGLYWLDPLEEDACDQVRLAAERGIHGFKVICDRYYPCDERAMETFKVIATTGRPILFHSGILWDGKPSSPYSKPAQFEALLQVDGLTFTLAHISWPWCDELIAVYGKFLSAHALNPDLAVEMFVDITPGTPVIYRREVLTKLYTVGYDVAHNVIFGTDCAADDYNVDWTREWIDRDKQIFAELGLSQDAVNNVYAENVKRFLRVSAAKVKKKTPRPAQS